MRKLFIISALLLSSFSAQAQNFDDYFEDKTLRLDYTFAGDATRQQIFVDELVSLPRWYGRKQHLAELPLKGNGQITVRSLADGMVIYRHSFSSLFQEWVSTAEAKQTQKSFENVFLVPFPKSPVEIKVELFDYHDQVITRLTHKVDPKDILIRKAGERQKEMEVFLNDCRIAMESLFEHEPFKQNQLKFNMVAVMPPSVESGTSEPNKGIWKNTPLGSHFDTFYSERYLTTLHLKKLHDVLAGIPYEHIIVLVNTDRYGGGGIYNSYNLTYAHGKHFRPVVVHEFGHSFGGLGDEYPYGDDDPMYFADTEPWEPNLTTKHDFNGKWENLIKDKKAGFIEGGGYLSKGVWRGYENCRMRTNEEPEFCLVCQQALQRLIDFYTK